MKYVGWSIGILCIGVGAWLVGMPHELALFVMVGKIPFTQIDIPALWLLICWIVALPVALGLRIGGKHVFWRLIEAIGRAHQRSLNRQIRFFSPHTRITHLLTITLLAISVDEPAPTTPLLRRRFAALPS